jgi:hypothetical protein
MAPVATGGEPRPGPAASEKIEATTMQRDRTDRATRRVPIANATRHRRSGRARFDRDLVRCPLCSFTHWHVAFEGATSYERSPACRPSTTYTVQVVRVVPAAVVPAAIQRQQGVA